MVIQVYTKPRTCHLVKYQYLLYSCFTGLRMLYIQAVFALLYLDRGYTHRQNIQNIQRQANILVANLHVHTHTHPNTYSSIHNYKNIHSH